MDSDISRNQDKRSIRSRKGLAVAFLSLVEERGLDGFSISDLTNRADLNRGTFYSHFKDKDDLLAYCEEEFLQGLESIEVKIAQVDTKTLGTPQSNAFIYSIFVELFEYLASNGVILKVLLGPNGDIAFEHRILECVCQTLIDKILAPKYREFTTPLVKYYVAYYSSAAYGVVRAWIEDDMPETPAEIAAILLRVVSLGIGSPIVWQGEEDE